MSTVILIPMVFMALYIEFGYYFDIFVGLQEFI